MRKASLASANTTGHPALLATGSRESKLDFREQDRVPVALLTRAGDVSVPQLPHSVPDDDDAVGDAKGDVFRPRCFSSISEL